MYNPLRKASTQLVDINVNQQLYYQNQQADRIKSFNPALQNPVNYFTLQQNLAKVGSDRTLNVRVNSSYNPYVYFYKVNQNELVYQNQSDVFDSSLIPLVPIKGIVPQNNGHIYTQYFCSELNLNDIMQIFKSKLNTQVELHNLIQIVKNSYKIRTTTTNQVILTYQFEIKGQQIDIQLKFDIVGKNFLQYSQYYSHLVLKYEVFDNNKWNQERTKIFINQIKKFKSLAAKQCGYTYEMKDTVNSKTSYLQFKLLYSQIKQILLIKVFEKENQQQVYNFHNLLLNQYQIYNYDKLGTSKISIKYQFIHNQEEYLLTDKSYFDIMLHQTTLNPEFKPQGLYQVNIIVNYNIDNNNYDVVVGKSQSVFLRYSNNQLVQTE